MNYTEMVTSTPDAAYLRAGDLIDFSADLLSAASELNHQVTFGSDTLPRIDDDQFHQILFHNACDIPLERFAKLDVDVGEYFRFSCDKVANGLLSKGMYAFWLEAVGMFTTRNNTGLSNR